LAYDFQAGWFFNILIAFCVLAFITATSTLSYHPTFERFMAPPRLALQNIHLSFGGDPILSGAEMSLHERDRLCLVGRNGSGKSSLLKIAAGLIEPDEGVRFLQPGTSVQYLEQEPDFSQFKTIADYVVSALDDESEAYKVAPYLDALGLDGSLDVKTLSGGEARRAALVRALAPEPDILFLDEPTNHLDLPAIEWLEKELVKLRSALVVISHDRRFLETVSSSVLWLDRGVSRLMKQNFSKFESWRDEVFAQEELDAHKRDRKIAMEEDWVRYGVTARRKRNQKRLGDLHALRQERRAHKGPQGSVTMERAESRISGKLVVEAKGLCKSYEGRLLVNDLDLRLMRGDRLGIVGPNGAGKSTIIKMRTGNLEPDEGVIKLGSNLDVVTLDQARATLKPNWTLADALTNGGGEMVDVGGKPKHVMGYMKDFLFDPSQARTPLDVLSGGERARVMLARALSLPSNFMVLDEPTNDLDLETLDLLEELIASYEGTVLLVSHDRDFIDRVVTSVLVWEGDGVWTEYAGGYSQARAQIKETITSKTIQEAGAEVKTNKKGSVVKASGASRLSYKDKYALETLPKEIEALEVQIKQLEGELADPDLFSKNPDQFNKTSRALAQVMSDHEALQERWLELEMKREELEG